MRDSLWNDFKMQVLRSGNTLNHLLAVNIAVFLVFGILWMVLSLLTVNPLLYTQIESWLALKASFGQLLFRPWTLVTYQFMHAGFFHILYNMLVLLMAGRIFREFLGDKKLLATYLLGGIVGGLTFMAAYNIFPLFAGGQNTPLVGASASILAVLAAAATLVPNYTVHIILLGPVRLVFIALFFFLLSFLNLGGNNAGGNFAHVGGALWGFVYIKALQNGYDLGGWLTRLLERTGKLFQPKPPVKMHYYNERGKAYQSKKVSQDEVDAILEKVYKSGYESLTQTEKDILFRASNNK